VSDTPAFQWGHEHFCQPDATELYNKEPQRLNDPALGFPKQLDELPETFCSVCLMWFVGPHPEGSEHRPPQKGTSNGN
jgi:hypothetical protein